MPIDKEHFLGIDVAKEWLDVAILAEKLTLQSTNTAKGIRELIRWMPAVLLC